MAAAPVAAGAAASSSVARNRLWARLNEAVDGCGPDLPATPLMVVDLDAFDANAADLARRAGGKPVRVASKSLRVPALIERALARDGFAGVLAYTVAEALWLHDHGVSDDVVVACPSVDTTALRRLTESGHDVTVVPTAAALEFVGAPTWAALSGKPVSSDVWESVHEVPHVRIGQSADLVLVAPAPDFTSALVAPRMTVSDRAALERDGAWTDAEGQTYSAALLEDGARWTLLPGPVEVSAPVRILQGGRDDAVPWRHALAFAEAFSGDDVVFSLVRDGDHRLSRPQDLARLLATVADATPRA